MKVAQKFAVLGLVVGLMFTSVTHVQAATWAQVALGIDCEERAPAGRYRGVYLTDTHDDQAASNAGLERGDIIAYVNGQRVRTYEQMQNAFMDDADGRVNVHVDDSRHPGYLVRVVLDLN